MAYGISFGGGWECGCCGHIELCEFENDAESGYYSDPPITGDTFQELFDNILTSDDLKGRLVSIHFIKRKKANGSYERLYEWSTLRTMIRGIKGVKHVATFINPNTGNKVDSYVWINK